MADLYLIVRLGGERLALRAADVDSVVEIDAPTPVPGAAGHVVGLSALRSRVLTVIDCLRSVDPARSVAEGAREAVMAVVDGHPYALLVDAVEDVVEASAEPRAPSALSGGWSRVGRAVVEAQGDLLLLLDIDALIAGPTREAA